MTSENHYIAMATELTFGELVLFTLRKSQLPKARGNSSSNPIKPTIFYFIILSMIQVHITYVGGIRFMCVGPIQL